MDAKQWNVLSRAERLNVLTGLGITKGKAEKDSKLNFDYLSEDVKNTVAGASPTSVLVHLDYNQIRDVFKEIGEKIGLWVGEGDSSDIDTPEGTFDYDGVTITGQSQIVDPKKLESLIFELNTPRGGGRPYISIQSNIDQITIFFDIKDVYIT